MQRINYIDRWDFQKKQNIIWLMSTFCAAVYLNYNSKTYLAQTFVEYYTMHSVFTIMRMCFSNVQMKRSFTYITACLLWRTSCAAINSKDVMLYGMFPILYCIHAYFNLKIDGFPYFVIFPMVFYRNVACIIDHFHLMPYKSLLGLFGMFVTSPILKQEKGKLFANIFNKFGFPIEQNTALAMMNATLYMPLWCICVKQIDNIGNIV